LTGGGTDRSMLTGPEGWTKSVQNGSISYSDSLVNAETWIRPGVLINVRQGA